MGMRNCQLLLVGGNCGGVGGFWNGHQIMHSSKLSLSSLLFLIRKSLLYQRGGHVCRGG